MKKALSLILTLVLCLSVCACGSDSSATSSPASPTKVELTTENVGNYFFLENTYSTSKQKSYGYYGVKISGNVSAKQSVTLVGMENVTMTLRVTYSVGRAVDGTLNAEKTYQTYEYDSVVNISAVNGSGSASYATNGHLTSPHGYPSVEYVGVEVIAVTGSVTIN